MRRTSFQIHQVKQLGAKQAVTIYFAHKCVRLTLVYCSPIISPGLSKKDFHLLTVFPLFLLTRLLIKFGLYIKAYEKVSPMLLQILPVTYVRICLPEIHVHPLFQSTHWFPLVLTFTALPISHIYQKGRDIGVRYVQTFTTKNTLPNIHHLSAHTSVVLVFYRTNYSLFFLLLLTEMCFLAYHSSAHGALRDNLLSQVKGQKLSTDAYNTRFSRNPSMSVNKL